MHNQRLHIMFVCLCDTDEDLVLNLSLSSFIHSLLLRLIRHLQGVSLSPDLSLSPNKEVVQEKFT